MRKPDCQLRQSGSFVCTENAIFVPNVKRYSRMKKLAITSLKLLPLVVAMLVAIPNLSAQESPIVGLEISEEEIREIEESVLIQLGMSKEEIEEFKNMREEERVEDVELEGLHEALRAEEAGFEPEKIDQPPKFGGRDFRAFHSWAMQRLVYPEKAQNLGLQGSAIVQFVVNKEGAVERVQIARTSGWKSLDSEALRVVKLSPRWTPGEHQGEKVSVVYSFPINFELWD